MGELKNGSYNGAIKNYCVGEYSALLTNTNLLANKSIYWSSPSLANESEHIAFFPLPTIQIWIMPVQADTNAQIKLEYTSLPSS